MSVGSKAEWNEKDGQTDDCVDAVSNCQLIITALTLVKVDRQTDRQTYGHQTVALLLPGWMWPAW